MEKRLAVEFLYCVAGGMGVEEALVKVGMSFSDYCDYRLTNSAFDKAVTRARRMAADHWVDRVVSEVGKLGNEYKEAKFRVETYEWLAERLNPDMYGARGRIEHDVRTYGVPSIEVVSSGDVARLAGESNGVVSTLIDLSRGEVK